MATPKMHGITRASLASLDLPKDARITDVKHLASYNWIRAPSPTIAVPGSPAAWSNIKQPKQVCKNSGLIYIAQNAARHPDYPLEPLFRAVDMEKPGFDMRSVDIVSDRNNIRKLLSFIDPSTAKSGLEPFTIKVEVAGQTVILNRYETLVKEFLGPNDFRGFGHEFEKAFTKDEVAGSTGHHRIINYRFNDLNVVIRHETDGYVRAASGDDNDDDIASMLDDLSLDTRGDKPSPVSILSSKLTIKKAGKEVSLASTLEIKTRVAHKPLPMDEGVFQVPTVEDTTAVIKSWETKNQKSLGLLATLMRKIVDVVAPLGRATIKYNEGSGRLEICKTEAKDMLPRDVYMRWNKTDPDQAAASDGVAVGSDVADVADDCASKDKSDIESKKHETTLK
ncbi:hypothetical protein M409DRAFT_19474 [Zasmidium cellare ATCC 36951]|uniref:Geranylgeranyl pyrophosphate synthetase n=1 Tax=Zasmidium cellare ATCC 36951 TaxID=1080233 RepID=A0A6A6CXX5_ZASCE|nr:uncharacterized protein M409DRAFT_19474 [Zasmidium cellare ATCC 36951]KAF2170659.1 hypothetical protein M409DRAFT_19474 [Zasmidium cellare ATCC 36951]